jgi:hypothetical protein
MKFIKYNANPYLRNTEDCAIRAISKALDKPWRDVLMELTQLGASMGYMPNHRAVTTKYLKSKGWTWHRGDKRRMKDYHFKSTHIVQLHSNKVFRSGHLTYCDDGIIYDTWNCEGYKVDGYFNPPKK